LIRSVFKEIDPAIWEATGHNPVLLLRKVPRSRLEELSRSNNFVDKVRSADEMLRHYCTEGFANTWYQRNYSPESEQLVAYFSAEFGVTECLKMYSGGLGILAGDHLKSASDLGIPLIGIGLFYKCGYFSQQLTNDGWQIESYPENNPIEIPVRPVTRNNESEAPLIISVPIDARQIKIRAWQADIGRIPLLLIDSNLPDQNSKEDCEITSQLYGGDIHTRIQQEILLGMGGARLLDAMGISPTVYHMNEGHAAFVILEKIRREIEGPERLSFETALNKVITGNVFTTHTPVAAGIDIFDRSLMEKYLAWYCARIGITLDELMNLGRDGPSHGAGFNMAVFALKYSEKVNAVSRLHKSVATKLWSDILQKRKKSEDGRPGIEYVTNGIHTPSWIAESFAEIYDEFLGRDWADNSDDPFIWGKVGRIQDEILWNAHVSEKRSMIDYVNHKAREKHTWKLSPDALTIGFGRRFATYKRASLILQRKDELIGLLKNTSTPIQFVFAGKAHPKDHEGKKLIQEIINFAGSTEANGKIAFLADYDISVARKLLQGVDVWLNNPRKPLEACGTSGMKAIANGVLNFSVLDGWWDEAYSPGSGWAIGQADKTRHAGDLRESSDKVDVESLYNVLESQIIPEFYDRDPSSGLPLKWISRMKNSISKDCPRFNTRRMVTEYARLLYFDEETFRTTSLAARDLRSDFLDQSRLDWN
jgi:glycogen phosphorylase